MCKTVKAISRSTPSIGLTLAYTHFSFYQMLLHSNTKSKVSIYTNWLVHLSYFSISFQTYVCAYICSFVCFYICSNGHIIRTSVNKPILFTCQMHQASSFLIGCRSDFLVNFILCLKN